MAKNYWQQKREHKDDGWIYLSHDFRIKHDEYKNHDWAWKLYEGKLVKVRVPVIRTDGTYEIHPHNIIKEESRV